MVEEHNWLKSNFGLIPEVCVRVCVCVKRPRYTLSHVLAKSYITLRTLDMKANK